MKFLAVDEVRQSCDPIVIPFSRSLGRPTAVVAQANMKGKFEGAGVEVSRMSINRRVGLEA
jgi:hypothetical protein